MKKIGIVVLWLVGFSPLAYGQEPNLLEKAIYGQISSAELIDYVKSHQTGTPLMSMMTYQIALDSLSQDVNRYISQVAFTANTVSGAYAGRWQPGVRQPFQFISSALSSATMSEPEIEFEGVSSKTKEFTRIKVKFNPNQTEGVKVLEQVGKRTDITYHEVSINASHQSPRAVQSRLEHYLRQLGLDDADVRVKTSRFNQTAIKDRVIASLEAAQTTATFRGAFSDYTYNGTRRVEAVRIANELISEKTDLSQNGAFGRSLRAYLSTLSGDSPVHVTFKTIRGNHNFSTEPGKGTPYQQILQQVRHALSDLPTADYLRVSVGGMSLVRGLQTVAKNSITESSNRQVFTLNNEFRLRGLVPRLGTLASYEVWIPNRLYLGADKLEGISGKVFIDGEVLNTSRKMERYGTHKDGSFTYLIHVEGRNLALFVNLTHDNLEEETYKPKNVIPGPRENKLLVQTQKYGVYETVYEAEFRNAGYPKPGARSCSFLANLER